jgi:D-glycerate 3-kinase
MSLQSLLTEFLRQHHLPAAYASVAQTWFVPLADSLAATFEANQQPLVVGIHGCQGSGKTTLADFLATYCRERCQMSVVSLSIDDFYLTRAERTELAEWVHSLLATRGVPGTHDVELANRVIDGLIASEPDYVYIPRFDKSVDDRVPDRDWDQIQGPVDMVILEGWCVGVPAQSADELTVPVNALEAIEDEQGVWRQYVNDALAARYPSLYSRLNTLIMLQAPSFDCVHQWRLQQEQKLARSLNGDSGDQIMNEGQILRFIQHYQRLTEHALRVLPSRVQHLYQLDSERQIKAYRQPLGTYD